MLHSKDQLTTCLTLLSILLGGCSFKPSDRPDLGAVHGAIKLDGQPLQGATVMFQPEDGRLSCGVTDASGAYVLAYTDKVSGAKVGHHTVQITTASFGEISNEKIPEKYNAKTTLTADVKAGKNEFNFDLESK